MLCACGRSGRCTSATMASFVLQVFATEAFEGEIVTSDEVSDHRWVRLDGLRGMKTTPGLGDVLERAFAIFDRT